MSGPPHSCVVATALCRRDPIRPDRAGRLQNAKKLLRKRRNESWAMRPAMAGQTSPTLESWRKLVMQNRPICFVVGIAVSLCSRAYSDVGRSKFPHRRAVARAPLPEGEGRVRAHARLSVLSASRCFRFPHRRAAARAPLPEGEGRVRAHARLSVLSASRCLRFPHRRAAARAPLPEGEGRVKAHARLSVLSASRCFRFPHR
ncbi:MAG: hypothetical protein QOE73_1291, partial [Verrucomicrobiota bacterium]